MTSLVACLGSGKGTWTEVKKLIASESWERVFLITNNFGKERFQADAEFIVLDDLQPPQRLIPFITDNLKGKIKGADVAVNISSGSGNLHMAVIAALLKLGLGIRLITLINEKVEEL